MAGFGGGADRSDGLSVVGINTFPNDHCHSTCAIMQRIGKEKAMMEHNVICRDQEILGGTPIFAGTRVPVQTLLDYLEGGQSLQEFLDDFPTVDRDQAITILEQLKQILLTQPV